MTRNWQEIRRDFPILKSKINGQPLIYLDNAATNQKPQNVIQALKDYYEQTNANVYRSVHTLSGKATQEYEAARAKVRDFIHAEFSEEIIFTSGTTESINMLARMLAKKLTENDEILLTYMEHHSNIVPWQAIAQETGAKIRYVDVTVDGRIALADYEAKLNERTKIVSFTHVSNVTGVINPVKEMLELAAAYETYTVVDGAQAIAHQRVDVQALNVDFYAFSAHKMYGPTGVGVLYGKKKLLEALEPAKFGGEMIELVEEQTSTWAALPHKFEGGTPNIAGVIGLGVAIDYLNEIGLTQIEQYESELTSYLLEQLATIEGLTIYGPKNTKNRVAVVSFNLDAIHPHDLATGMDLDGIAIRAGHHCAQLLNRKMDVYATSRISLSFYNNKEEIDQAIISLNRLKEFFSE